MIACIVALRLSFPATFIFMEDEARAVDYALKVTRDHTFLTHTWPSSVGVTNSPVFIYLIAPFVALSSSPLFITLCLNILNIASLPIGYAFLKRILDEREARMTVLIWGISPVAIHYSQKIWDPVPLPLFSAALAYACVRVLTGTRSKWIFWVPLISSVMAQIHQSGAFFCGVALFALVIHRPRIHWPSLAGGIIAGGAAAVPYLMYFLESGFGELTAYGRRFGGNLPDIDVVTNFFMNVTGHSIFNPAGRDSLAFLNWPFPFFGGAVAVVLLLLLPIVVFGAVELHRRATLRLSRRRPFVRPGDAPVYNFLMLLTWGLPVLYLLLRVPGWPHYFIVAFPVVFALVPLGVTRLRRNRPRYFLTRLVPALVVLIAIQSLCFQSMTTYRRGGTSFGVLQGFARQIAGEVLAEARRDDNLEPEGRTLRVSINGPRPSSGVPVQWQFLFREEFGVMALSPGNGPYYSVTIRWDTSAWSRGEYDIELTPERQPR